MSGTTGRNPFSPRPDTDPATEVEAERSARDDLARDEDDPGDPDILADMIRRRTGRRF